MKNKDVEAIILESGQVYEAPRGLEESHGVGAMLIVKVTADNGLIGYADVETQPHVAKVVIDAPLSGTGMIDGLRETILGEGPRDVEKLRHKMFKATAYDGRRGVAIQALSGIANCLEDDVE